MKKCPKCGFDETIETKKKKERNEWIKFMNKTITKNLTDWSEYENKISESEGEKAPKLRKR